MRLVQKLPLVLLFLCSTGLAAQEFSYSSSSVQDGLVQSQVMCLFQDNEGYIWVGTKGGVSRFDGVSFVNFSNLNGLPQNYVFMITEDGQGNVWIMTDGGLAKWDGENMIPFPTDHFKDKIGFITMFDSGSGGMTILFNGHEGRLRFTLFNGREYKDITSEYKVFVPGNLIINKYSIDFDRASNSLWMAVENEGIYHITGNTIRKVDVSIQGLKYLKAGNDGRIYLLGDQTLYRLDGNRLEPVHHLGWQDDSYGKHIAVDRRGVMYFSDPFNRISILDQGELVQDHYNFTLINVMMIDQEDQLWIGTETGIFRLTSRAFFNYIPSRSGINQYIWSISEDRNGMLWFGSYGAGLQSFDGKNFVRQDGYDFLFPKSNTYFYMGSVLDHKGNLILPIEGGCIQWTGSEFRHYYNNEITATPVYFYEDPQTLVMYGATNQGLYTRSPNGKESLIDVLPGDGRSRFLVCINKDRLGRIWLGGFKGVSILDQGNIIHLPTPEMPYEFGGNAILRDSLDNIWLGSPDGLYFYDYTSFKKIEIPGLSSMILSLCMVGDSGLLIGSIRRLDYLDLHSFYRDGILKVRHFDGQNGFQGSEIGQNSIFRDSRDQYWIATSDRVVKIDPDKISLNHDPPQTYIYSISSLSNKMQWQPEPVSLKADTVIRLPFYKKNLRFDFTGISTSAPLRVNYSYRLEGFDDGWSVPETERYAVYTNLRPGDYTLWLKACNADGIWSDGLTHMHVRIIPAIWQIWWVWAILGLILAMVLVFSGVAIATRRRKKHRIMLETEKKMAQLQLLTIKNQIDPHFTFNAINSISSVLLKDNKELAYHYFVKFSHLIRNILQSSDQLTRTLEDEIEFVKDYLEIEKFRFKDKFEFHFQIDPEVKLLKLVPKMVIQTFAENSLKHGIIHLAGKGVLVIRVSGNGGVIRIEVEDNGIGRIKARQYSSLSTGKGLMIMSGYIEFFNRYNEEKISWEITDLYDADRQPTGTRATVIIPDSFTCDV